MSSTFSLGTERLLLRAAEPGDAGELVRLHDDPLVARYLGVRDRDWYEWRLGVSAEEWVERGHGLVTAAWQPRRRGRCCAGGPGTSSAPTSRR